MTTTAPRVGDTPTTAQQALAEAWAEGHRTGWEHCQDGNYGNDHWDDPTPNPYAAAARAETTTADCPECGDNYCRCGIDWTADPRAETTTATDEDAALTIRYATLNDGTVELDEVVASNATVHLEKMDTASWWLGIGVNGEHLAVNLGVDEYGNEFAHAEPETDKVHVIHVELDGKQIASLDPPGLVTSRPLATARTRPTRDKVALTIFGTLARHFEVVAGQLDGINAAADAVLALLADQPETTTEWGVRFYGRGPFDVACDSREDAEAEVAAVEDKHAPAVLIRREVTAWTEADQ